MLPVRKQAFSLPRRDRGFVILRHGIADCRS
jgi:hypothetical protein